MNKQVDIENYLLGGAEENGDQVEDRIFADDQYFFELCDTENTLVDRYAAGGMSASDAARFRSAAAANPNLAAKAANARILNAFVRSERPRETPRAPGFWEGVRDLFAFSPVPSFALGGIFLFIAALCGFLLVENSRRNAEIARLEFEISNSRPPVREAELENELNSSKSRESELHVQVDEERDLSGDLASDLAKERKTRRHLEREIANLKGPGGPDPARTGEETVSVLQLDADSQIDDEAIKLNTEGGAERVSLMISIPAGVPADARVSIRLNAVEIRRNVALSALIG